MSRVLWIMEWGAVDLPMGHPSRITCVQGYATEEEARGEAAKCEFNTSVFPVADLTPRPAPGEPGAVKAVQFIRELAAPATGTHVQGMTDDQLVEIARYVGLRTAMHGYNITEVRSLLRAFVNRLVAPTTGKREPLTLDGIAKALAGAGLLPEDYREDGQIEPLVRAIESAHGITGEQ